MDNWCSEGRCPEAHGVTYLLVVTTLVLMYKSFLHDALQKLFGYSRTLKYSSDSADFDCIKIISWA